MKRVPSAADQETVCPANAEFKPRSNSDTASEEQLRQFVSAFGATPFPRADEVISLVRGVESASVEVFTGTTVRSLCPIYRARATRLASQAIEPPYPATLPRDVCLLADALDAADDQPVRIWSIIRPDGQSFLVFELTKDSRIAGVVESVDRRIVAPE